LIKQVTNDRNTAQTLAFVATLLAANRLIFSEVLSRKLGSNRPGGNFLMRQRNIAGHEVSLLLLISTVSFKSYRASL